MRTNNSQIGPIRKAILQYLTKLQELSLGSGYDDLYSFFTKLHFRVYSGTSLKKCVLSDNIDKVDMFAKAAHRHANMVVSIVYKDSSKAHKKMIKGLAVSAFTKNFLLDKEV